MGGVSTSKNPLNMKESYMVLPDSHASSYKAYTD